jgi:tryptophan halogenase
MKICIVGGGTAGWLAALYFKKVFSHYEITVIESSKIGILGAGEGTTPHFINFLDFIDIPVSSLIKHCDATIKNGIKFTNWNNNNKYYYHSFNKLDHLDINFYNESNYLSDTVDAYIKCISLNQNVEEIDILEKISEKNLVPFVYDKKNYKIDPILDFYRIGDFALHFNAAKLATFLKKVALERGVKLIDSEVISVNSFDNGDIKSLILKGGLEINGDFYIDSTGFSRLLIGKHFKCEWVPYSKELTVNTAIPFFLDYESDEIPPYTEAIAMKYGWMWRIPTKERYGCGYVFDCSFISNENAIDEIELYFGKKIDSPKTFKFEAGFYNRPWIKNCVSIGISSGFIEPLEASSIFVIILMLKKLLQNSEFIFSRNEKIINEYNEYCKGISDEIKDFLYFHYMSNRVDTDFWKHYTVKNSSSKLKQLNDSWNLEYPKFKHISKNQVFSLEAWISVGLGINFFDKKIFNSRWHSNKYNMLKENVNLYSEKCYNHKDLLNYLSMA